MRILHLQSYLTQSIKILVVATTTILAITLTSCSAGSDDTISPISTETLESPTNSTRSSMQILHDTKAKIKATFKINGVDINNQSNNIKDDKIEVTSITIRTGVETINASKYEIENGLVYAKPVNGNVTIRIHYNVNWYNPAKEAVDTRTDYKDITYYLSIEQGKVIHLTLDIIADKINFNATVSEWVL
ncbi:hypothetical protein [Segatella albensis]|uniref:hypothetical protein n=1 Tax=Segatella albensis TaxID=77768 RepID=UPI0012B626E6|nr:hypothetical protein [Segatella albensis]